MTGDDVENAITVDEYREKLAREDLVQGRLQGPSKEQVEAIERLAKAAGLRVNASAIKTEEEAGRVIWSLTLLARRMR